MEKFIIEVAVELAWPSLRVKLSLSHRKGSLICLALCMVDVLVLTSSTFLLGFIVPRGAIDADVEDSTSTEGRERKLLGCGFGEGLCRALGLRVRILLLDGLEGCFWASPDVQHVNSRRKLVGDLVGERMDTCILVSEFAP